MGWESTKRARGARRREEMSDALRLWRAGARALNSPRVRSSRVDDMAAVLYLWRPLSPPDLLAWLMVELELSSEKCN